MLLKKTLKEKFVGYLLKALGTDAEAPVFYAETDLHRVVKELSKAQSEYLRATHDVKEEANRTRMLSTSYLETTKILEISHEFLGKNYWEIDLPENEGEALGHFRSKLTILNTGTSPITPGRLNITISQMYPHPAEFLAEVSESGMETIGTEYMNWPWPKIANKTINLNGQGSLVLQPGEKVEWAMDWILPAEKAVYEVYTFISQDTEETNPDTMGWDNTITLTVKN
jgi:hypothetical protein